MNKIFRGTCLSIAMSLSLVSFGKEGSIEVDPYIEAKSAYLGAAGELEEKTREAESLREQSLLYSKWADEARIEAGGCIVKSNEREREMKYALELQKTAGASVDALKCARMKAEIDDLKCEHDRFMKECGELKKKAGEYASRADRCSEEVEVLRGKVREKASELERIEAERSREAERKRALEAKKLKAEERKEKARKEAEERKLESERKRKERLDRMKGSFYGNRSPRRGR